MAGPGINLIGQAEIDEVVEVLRSRHLSRYGRDDDPTFGAKVRHLELEVARLCGVRYALGVNSGTSALWCALGALGIGPGDEVIVPGFTFVASISAIVYSGALPVLAEVDASLNLDPVDVEARITPRTRAIMVVHMLGNPARLAELKGIADQHGLLLIEDCAQAFGARYRGQAVGSYGAVGILSFNEFKTVTCGDGGMIVTNDEAIYRRCFALHDQGHSPLRLGVDVGERPFLGLNFRMIELAGAVLLAQVRRLPDILARLRANKRLFKALLADVPSLGFRELPDPEGDLATHLVVLFPDETIARGVARELGSRVLADSGWHIYTQMEHLLMQRTASMRGAPFNSPGEPVADHYRPGMLPRTDDLVRRAMSIGIGVADPNLGSTFGVTVLDGPAEVQARAAVFREVATKYLGAAAVPRSAATHPARHPASGGASAAKRSEGDRAFS
ncbi:MAG TPA: DegT/DnrJ/EryC1/StrS family aminotransferase [Chloroflexota bacterium]|nr:DegT/DnrJ/EryC1/StrS family aminotransferase [Chloroflexota bacterium]